MMAIYLFCVTLGGVLVLTSMVLGGDGGDADAEADADVDGEAGGGGGGEWSVLPFGSLRFWTFLMLTFGLTGALLQLAGLPPVLVAAVAAIAGSSVGWSAFHLFRWLAREQVSGAVGLHGYVDQEGRVLLPVRPGAVGKIVIESMSGRVELTAVTGDPAPIEAGATVLVVGIDAEGRAEVTSLAVPDPTRQRAPIATPTSEGQP